MIETITLVDAPETFYDTKHPDSARVYVFDQLGNRIKACIAVNTAEGWLERYKQDPLTGAYVLKALEKTDDGGFKSDGVEIERISGTFIVKLRAK